MEKKRKPNLLLIFILTIFFSGSCLTDIFLQNNWSIVSPVFAETTDEYVSLGIQALELRDIVSANDYFSSAVKQTPGHKEANLYYAVTRIIALAYSSEFNTLLDRFGMENQGRDLFDWQAQLPTDMEGDLTLPSNSPTGADIVAFIRNILLPEIDGAISNLNVLSDTSSDSINSITIFTAAMTGSDTNLEVDYGDVALYKSMLHVLKSILLVVTSYDLNIDIDSLLRKLQSETFDLKRDVINAYPKLLTLSNSEMSTAKTSLIDGIDSLNSAIDFISTEQDPQNNDLISFDPEDIENAKEFQLILSQINNSLRGKTSKSFSIELSQFIHLGNFFDNPINLRDFLHTSGMQSLLNNQILYQIDWALTNTAGVKQSFNQIITPDNFPIGESFEIDYGDIALLRSALYFLKSNIKTINAYNIDVDIFDMIERLDDESFSINNNLLKIYPGLLKLLTNHELGSAKTDLEKAIDEYFAGSDFIRAERDIQSNDLVVFDENDLEDDMNFRGILSDIKDSLNGKAVVIDAENSVKINLEEFYNDPIDLQFYLPQFTDDNQILINTFPDPTMNGILPRLTQNQWNQILSLDDGNGGERIVSDIKANGSDGPINIASTGNLSVTIELSPGEFAGDNADWWLVAVTPFGLFHYQPTNGQWSSDLTYSHQGPLFNLGEFEVLNISGLPAGECTVYFGVDMLMNGSLDMDQAYYDIVTVNVQ